jgi:LCP family protein required for cell wall assembly
LLIWLVVVGTLAGVPLLTTVAGCWPLAYGHEAGGSVGARTLVPPTTRASSPTLASSHTPLSPTPGPPASAAATEPALTQAEPTLEAKTVGDSPSPTPTPYPTLALPEGPIIVLDSPASGQSPAAPEQVPPIEQPENAINIVVLGSDQISDTEVGRTDVMVLVTINPDLPSVSLLSIPRDYYVWLPSRGYNKINTAFTYGEKYGYPGGGPGLIKATIEYNLGIRVHYYARVSFAGFIEIVDALGGIDIAVECPIHDTFPDDESPTGQRDVDLLPGIHHFDGKHALWFVRSRYGASDFHRNRRQHQVLRAMYGQMVGAGLIAKLAQVWPALSETVSTDLGLRQMLFLASVASRLDMIDVKSRFVGPSVMQAQHTLNGLYVLLSDPPKLRSMVEEAVAPPAAGRATQRPTRVGVLNASPYAELGYVAAERLRWENFEVVSVERSEEVAPRTYIFDYTTTTKGSPLAYLMRLYRRGAGDVIAEPSPDSTVDFLVVLGADYTPCIGAWDSQPHDD